MQNYNGIEIVNVGVGEDISIKELAEIIKDVVGFAGEIVFESSKPDGTPRKLLDVNQLYSAGWQAKTSLLAGIEETYRWYIDSSGSDIIKK